MSYFKAKMHQIRFKPLAGFKGPISKGKEGRRSEWGKGGGGNGLRGREGKGVKWRGSE